MKRRPSILALFIALAALFFVRPASAAVVRDGTEFSVDLSAAHICWVLPHDLRDPADCVGLQPDTVEADLDRDFRQKAVAMGLVRLERDGEEADLAVLTITKVTVFGAVAADPEGAKDYTTGAEEELKKDLPIGGRLAPSNVKMVKPGALPLIRAVFTINGIPETSDKKLTEQQIHHAVFTKDGGYVVVWVGRHSARTRLETLADAAAPTIAVAHPAGTRGQLEKTFEGIFTIIFAAIGAVVIGVAALVAFLRKKSQPAYAGYGAYGGYGASSYANSHGVNGGYAGYGAYGAHAPHAHAPQPNAWAPSAAPGPYGPPPSHGAPPAAQQPSAYGPTGGTPSMAPAPAPAPAAPASSSYEPPKNWWDQPR